MARKETALCCNCYGLIEFDNDAWEGMSEGETICVEICPSCGHKNSIYYTLEPDYDTCTATDEDIKTFLD